MNPRPDIRLLYITDLERRVSGGGSYAVNWHAVDQLDRRFTVDYGGPLVPRELLTEKLFSRIRRKVFHRPGKFAYFSEKVLSRNAELVNNYFDSGHDAICFRSATRWCRVRPKVPYFIYLDAVFHTFFHNTFRPEDFAVADLERIWREEAGFLEKASGVFFESQWGLERAREAYGLSGHHYHAVGRGGVVEPPDRDIWDGESLRLVTMAMKFRQKGGDIVLEAYRLLKRRFPRLSWHILGGPPEGDWETVGGIVYEGMLSPDEPAGASRLRELLSQAFLLLHPTREDVNPLVPTEAAYFGCPCITVNRFALPEIVLHGKTGLLLEHPVTADALAASVAELIEDMGRYRDMRIVARQHALESCRWDVIGHRMASVIRDRLGNSVADE